MQVVVNISDSFYYRLIDMNIDSDTCSFNESALVEAIQNGTPLPKGHGRLIDADAICKDIISALGIRNENYLLEAEKAVYKRIKNAPTIIEADKEDKE